MNKELAKQLSQSVRDFYEKQGDWFATTRGKILPEQEFVSSYIKAGMTIVDVGAGNGRLAKILPEGVNYIGIEPSDTLRMIANNPTSPPRFLVPGSLPTIPLPNQIVDGTVCLAVLHHIPTQESRLTSVAELIRITKPGGIILATSWLHNPHGNEVIAIKEGEPGDYWMPWHGPDGQALRYVHFMQPDEWRTLWTHPALDIIQIGMHSKQDWTNDESQALNWRVIARRRYEQNSNTCIM